MPTLPSSGCPADIRSALSGPEQPRAIYACPHFNADLVPRTPSRWSPYGAIGLAVVAGLVGGALFTGLQPADLRTPEMFVNQLSAAAQQGWDGFTDWVHRLVAELR